MKVVDPIGGLTAVNARSACGCTCNMTAAGAAPYSTVANSGSSHNSCAAGCDLSISWNKESNCNSASAARG